MNNAPVAKQLLKLKEICPGLTRIVAYSPELAAMLGGDVDAALFLAQLCYWDGKQRDKEHGFIRKSQKELEEELGMSPDRQKRARKVLESAGLIGVTKKGRIPPTLGFRIKKDKIEQMWTRYSSGQTSPFGCEKKEKGREINCQNLRSKKSPDSAKTGVRIGQNEMLNNEDTIRRVSAEYIADEGNDLIEKDYFKDDDTDRAAATEKPSTNVKDDNSESSQAYQAPESDGLFVGGDACASSYVSCVRDSDEDDHDHDIRRDSRFLDEEEDIMDEDVDVIYFAAKIFSE